MTTTVHTASPHSFPGNVRKLQKSSVNTLQERKELIKELLGDTDFILNENTNGLAKKFFTGRYLCPFQGNFLKETNSMKIADAIISAISDPEMLKEVCFFSVDISERIKKEVLETLRKKFSNYTTVYFRSSGERTFLAITGYEV